MLYKESEEDYAKEVLEMASIEREEGILFYQSSLPFTFLDTEIEHKEYLIKVAAKENFLKSLDPPTLIPNSELHKQKEDLVINKNGIER